MKGRYGTGKVWTRLTSLTIYLYQESSRTQYFHLRSQIISGETTSSSMETSNFSFNPKFSQIYTGAPRARIKIGGLRRKVCGLQWKDWSLLRISNENPGVSNKKIGVSEENMGVFDETVKGGSLIVLQ